MGKSDVVRMLRGVRTRLTPPAQWTQGAFARDAYGRLLGREDKNCVCWCLLGAANREPGDPGDRLLMIQGLAAEALRWAKSQSLAAFNDEHTHGEVLELSQSLAAFNDEHTHGEVLELIDRTLAERGAK